MHNNGISSDSKLCDCYVYHDTHVYQTVVALVIFYGVTHASFNFVEKIIICH